MSSKRLFYRVDFVSESALSIGAADSVKTDNDVVLDSRNLPIIPATSLAGVYRSYFNEDKANRFFGIRLKEGKGEISESSVRVYDAVWLGGNNSVSVRHNVSLKNKVAIPGLKFDRQVVEQGAKFRTVIELRDAETCPPGEIEKMLGAIADGRLRFGSKTTRGFGLMRIESCKRARFDLSIPESRAAWLDFDMFDSEHWAEPLGEDIMGSLPSVATGQDAPIVRIELDLLQKGAVSVREYSTEPGRPDFGQLYIRGLKDAGEELPVIPGTTWSGAFRERYELFGGKERTDNLFGFVGKDENTDAPKTVTQKSRISFSESVLRGGAWKEITRNAVDRFTGGTKDGALFTLRTYYSGKTQLVMLIDFSGVQLEANDLAPLLATLADLHNGFLPIGGLTSVGHGLFFVTSARLSVGSLRYRGFYEELFGNEDVSPSQPNINEIAGKVAHLLTQLNSERGEHE